MRVKVAGRLAWSLAILAASFAVAGAIFGLKNGSGPFSYNGAFNLVGVVGLQGMADRLDAIGGMLQVRSRPGEGTCHRSDHDVGIRFAALTGDQARTRFRCQAIRGGVLK